MYSYAISLGSLANEFDPRWEESFQKCRIKDVEITLKTLNEPATSEICRRMVKNKIINVASVHLPFWEYDFAALDETERKKSIDYIKELLEKNADFLATPNMTLHCSKEGYSDAERGKNLRQSIRSVRELLPTAKEFGATLNIEFLPRTCIGRNENELLHIAKEFSPDEVGICMDVNHTMTRYAELPDIIRTLAQRIRTFHISDYDGIDERHWFVGQGIIDWVEVMKAIREVPDNPVLIFETDAVLNGAYSGRKIPADPIFSLRQMEFQQWYLENCAEIRKQVWG